MHEFLVNVCIQYIIWEYGNVNVLEEAMVGL